MLFEAPSSLSFNPKNDQTISRYFTDVTRGPKKAFIFLFRGKTIQAFQDRHALLKMARAD